MPYLPPPSTSPGRDPRPGLYAIPAQRGSRPAPYPDPTRPRASEDPTLRCHGIIYAFPIYDFDPRTGLALPPDPKTGLRKIRLDYVGQTIRRLEVRRDEHLDDKPWADLVAGDPIVIAEGEWVKAERDAAEISAIAKIRPRFNHEHNLANPQRIEMFRQIAHRHARDDAAGRPRWVPLEQRTAQAAQRALQAVLGAGLDGREPRYPLTVAWQAVRATGRVLAGTPRWLRLTLAAPTCWALAGWYGQVALQQLGWPRTLARCGALTLCTVLLLAVLRSKALRRWAKRRPRRRR